MSTNTAKSADATPSNTAKSSASKSNRVKAGQGYDYDSYLAYDELADPISGNSVNYDAIGTTPVVTNISKS